MLNSPKAYSNVNVQFTVILLKVLQWLFQYMIVVDVWYSYIVCELMEVNKHGDSDDRT